MDTVNLKKARQDDINNSSVDMGRMAKSKMRLDLYNGNTKPYALNKLKEIYTQAIPNKLDKQLDNGINLLQSIVRKVSGVYSGGVERNIENEQLLELYNDVGVDRYMKESNYLMNALNDIIIQISVSSKDEIKLVFRYPHNTKVELDADNEVYSVEYFVSVDEASKEEKWAYWTIDSHYYKVYDSVGDYRVEYIEDNEEGVNPYTVMPFVYIQKGFRDFNFFDEFNGQNMVDGTLDGMVYNTFKKYLIKWQSFKTLVILGQQVGQIDGQQLDPQSPLVIQGEGTDIKMLDIQTDIKSLAEVINDDLNSIAMDYGVSASSFNQTGNVQSGFALLLQNMDVDNIILEQQANYEKHERDLGAIIQTVSNEALGTTYSEEVKATFPPIKYPRAESEMLDNAQKGIDLCLTSPIEIIQKEQDITEDEAREIFDKNKADRDALNQRVALPTATTTIPNEE